MIGKDPLVSVCIVTYNSSSFIIEALDSVAAQTYRSIELIVSDDCSTDDTVEMCQQWMYSHSSRFVNTAILKNEHNAGVSRNCNRAIRKSMGEWIKYLAGDDKLLPNCISDNVDYIQNHIETDLLFSDMKVFGQGQSGNGIVSPSVYFNHLTTFQFKIWQLVYSLLPAPCCFMKRSVYTHLGGFDESIPMMEDKPFWVKAIFAKSVIKYLPKTTVCYRVNSESLSQSKENSNYRKFAESRKLASRYFLSLEKNISWWLWFYVKSIYDREFSPSFSSSFVYGLRFLNPYYYYLRYIYFKIRFFSLLHSSGIIEK